MSRRTATFTILIFIAAIIIIAMIFTALSIYEMPWHRITTYSSSISYDKQQKEPVLERDSIVSSKQLEQFLLFSTEDSSPEVWKEEMISTQKLEYVEKEDNYLQVTDDLVLPRLMNNNCDQRYCYQHRMPFDQIPSVFWKGLIGIEDTRFLDHGGIDFKSIARAIVADLREMKLVQGGSTLTQQLVKNLFLSNEKTLTRKLKEIIFSTYIEYYLSKEQILEAYFNEVFWGSLQGIQVKGLLAASLYYFGVKPSQIDSYQAAILISLLKGPNYYHPLRHMDRLMARTNMVYNKLVSLHLFDDLPETKWTAEMWQKWQEELVKREKSKSFASIWRVLRAETEQNLFNSFELYVFEESIRQVLREVEGRIGDKDISVKVVMGRPGGESDDQLFSYYSKIERNKQKAIQEERHQVGSILKPVIYDIFLNNGMKLNDQVSLEPLTLKLKSGRWTPKEAVRNYPEQTTLQDALLKSYNVPVIRIAQQVGFDVVAQSLIDYIPALKLPLKEYPAQLLGSVELTVREVFQLYAKFIGKECESGELSDENLLYLLSDPRKTTVRRVVDQYMKNLRFFGKTGTSNHGFDNWYVFFDGWMMGAIWVGYEGRREGENFPLFGGSTAFKIYQSFLQNRGKRFSELMCQEFSNKSL